MISEIETLLQVNQELKTAKDVAESFGGEMKTCSQMKTGPSEQFHDGSVIFLRIFLNHKHKAPK